MDYTTAEKCASQLLDNGCDRAEIAEVGGKPDTYEVVVYLNTEDGDEDGYRALFSIQAYTPLIQFSLP